MTIADEADLIRSVLGRPDDDSPRLAYADWLRRARWNDSRAEHISLSCSVRQMRRQRADYAEWFREHARANEIARAEGTAWVPQGVTACTQGAAIRRGFVEEVTLTVRGFLDVATVLYDLAPIRHLVLRDVQGMLVELFDSPHLERIVSLELGRQSLGDRALAMLAHSSRLSNLRWLDLSCADIGQDGIEALAASTTLPNLCWVGLGGNRVPDPTATPGGVDWAFGSIYDFELPDAGRLLADRFGMKPWLCPTESNEMYWPPDKDDFPH
jgi:uncharacterized protein (TIGR02996 family)